MPTVQELRARFPAFVKHFTDDDCRDLLDRLKPAQLGAGDTPIRFGEPSDTLYLVLGGWLNIHVDKNGESLLLGQVGPGAIVGEVGLIEPGPASATVEAMEDVTALALSHATFRAFAQERPAAASRLLHALSHELVGRLRRSSAGIVLRVDDHHWMQGEARRDRPGWMHRIAELIRGTAGSAS